MAKRDRLFERSREIFHAKFKDFSSIGAPLEHCGRNDDFLTSMAALRLEFILSVAERLNTGLVEGQ